MKNIFFKNQRRPIISKGIESINKYLPTKKSPSKSVFKNESSKKKKKKESSRICCIYYGTVCSTLENY